MLASLALLSFIFYGLAPEQYLSPWTHLCSGGAMLGAFFIATDYVTSPSSPLGKLIFAAGCGALVFVIRTWGGFPEAVGFAVLFMNALTPLIDRYVKPRVYGRKITGASIKHTSAHKVN